MVSRRITLQTVFRVSSSQVSCRNGEETFVLQVDSGRYLGMDSVGTTIWEFMQEQPRTFEQIRDYVLQEFDVSVEECEAGVLDMVQELLANGLLEVQESPAN
jgi:hypothetical protein